LATDSLAQLKQYTDLRNNSGAWKIELSKNPMPKPTEVVDEDSSRKESAATETAKSPSV
jgi:hypothetical protein